MTRTRPTTHRLSKGLAAGWLFLAAAPVSCDDVLAPSKAVEAARPFLVEHCGACHTGDRPVGRWSVEGLSTDLSDAAVRELWARMAMRVRSGDMPPADDPQPSAEQRDRFLQQVTPAVRSAEDEVRARQGRVVLRRLNRVEYENTLRDLLGVSVKLQSQLPQDGAADGFDNAAAAQHTSSFLLERYLDAAEIALNAAITNRPQPPKRIDGRFSLKDGHPVRATQEDVYRFGPDGEVTCLCSSEWHNASISKFYPADAGRYRFRIAASAVNSHDKPVTFRVTVSGTRLSGKQGLVGYFDAPPDEPRVFEFVHDMDAKTTISVLPYGLAGANTVKQVGSEAWDGPGLVIHYVDVEGPLHDAWPPESHRRLLGELPQVNVPAYNFRDRVEVASDAPAVDAERILRDFVRRAFRRPVSAADIAPYLTVFGARLSNNATFETALRAALKGVLTAPDFLFLQESPGKLDDHALACRLSYCLWSSLPDETLSALADEGRLSDPEVLRSQVERLLADPRSAMFVENFVGQWLGLREIDATEPSHILYPEFDHLLKVSMLREAELFFDDLLRNDLSLTNIVDSDHAWVNGRLARHYGLSGIDGWEFQRVALPEGSRRGGVLTMAGVLKVTANGTTTSPVLRGAWVLDRILGTPPPPPPENVGTIDPDTRGATTIREQLAKHRSVAECAVCHRSIDPPGFALESFDCIGGWREHYRATGNGRPVHIDGRRMGYLEGQPVDPAGETATGRPFRDIDEFKALLLDDRDQVARALTVKLITYATGRAPQTIDREAVDAIVADAAEAGYGLRTLVHLIIRSEFFQRK